MTDRIILGQRGGISGVWVSKPGVNVHTAGDDDMLMATNIPAFQIVASGVIYSPASNTNYDFAIPNLGLNAIVLLSGAWVAAYTFPNATTLRVHVLTQPYGAGGSALTWAVTNQPIQH